jgi:hypothetical protein
MFRRVIAQPFTTLPDGKRVLQCHSRGDRRFSPFNCFVEAFGVTASIEHHYQVSKVFEGDRRPRDWREAKNFKKPVHLGGRGLRQIGWQIGPLRLPVRPNASGTSFVLEDFGIQLYCLLWLRYLLRHPELITIASEFDEYEDCFRGDFPFCQADVIRQVVKSGVESLRPMAAELTTLLAAGQNSGGQ